MDEKTKKYLEDLHGKISAMSPDERMKFIKELNEMMSEVRSATYKFRNELKELRDKVKAEELAKKIKE